MEVGGLLWRPEEAFRTDGCTGEGDQAMPRVPTCQRFHLAGFYVTRAAAGEPGAQGVHVHCCLS